MKHSTLNANTVSVLTKGALFSMSYTTCLILIIVYTSNTYKLGKFEIWPFGAFLLMGEMMKFFVLTSNDGPLKPPKLKKTAKLKPRDFPKCLLITFTMVFMFYIIAVLFGAPLLEQNEETLMFSLLLTALTVFPLLLNLGPDATISVLTSLTAYEGEAFTEIYLVTVRIILFGAWLGAVVIPLDWDRPWQAWPIPCSLGALVGYIVAQVFIVLLNMPKVAEVFVRKSGKYDL